MPVSVDKRVNTAFQLGAVHDRAPRDGVLFVDGVKWADVDLEREFGLNERTDEGTET